MNTAILHIKDHAIENYAAFNKFLKEHKDGKFTWQSRSLSKRTLPMNSYLHGVLIPEFRKALNSVGYSEVKTDAQAKLIIKSMFLKRQIVNHETGELIEYVADTRDLTKEEMASLFEEVARFAAENMNYYIPMPGEQLMVRI